MNIKIRYLEYADLNNLIKVENDQRYWHLSGTTTPFTKEELSNYIINAKSPIESFGQLRFVIDVDNQFIGLIDLYEYNSIDKKAGIGIILLDEFQNKGISFKALELLKDHCAIELNLRELFAIIEVDNINSIRLFKKCNFKKLKKLKNYLKKNNQQVDCVQYQFLF